MSSTLSYEPGRVLNVLTQAPALASKINNPEQDCGPELRFLISLEESRDEQERNTIFYFAHGDYYIHLVKDAADFIFPEWLGLFFESSARLIPRAVEIDPDTEMPLVLTRSRVHLLCSTGCCDVEANAERNDRNNDATEYRELPAAFRVIIEGQVAAGLEQVFVVDAFREFCRKTIHIPVDNNDPVIQRQGGQCINPTASISNTQRTVAVSAIVGPLAEEIIYPHWWGSSRHRQEVDYDEYLRFEGSKRIWEVYNTTPDNKALDACLLASRPGQTVRFVGEHTLIRSYIRSGRELEGYTATITRPSLERLDESLNVSTSTLDQMLVSINALKASYQRHLRTFARGTQNRAAPAVHQALPPPFKNTRINDIGVDFPLARDLNQAVSLANELLAQFLRHRSNRHHHPLGLNVIVDDSEAEIERRVISLDIPDQELRRRLVQAINFMLRSFVVHFLDTDVHFKADINNLPGFVPQQSDRTFTTEEFARDTPACDERGPERVSFRGFTFQVDPLSQGPFNGFELEQAPWIFLGASANTQGVLTAKVEDCTFSGSPSDGVSVHNHVVAVISRCHAKDCFRAGFTITSGNSNVKISELLTQGGPELRSGIDVEVDQFKRGIRFLIERDAPGPVDSTYTLVLRNVYLSRNLQLTTANGLDTLSQPSSVNAEGLVCDAGPYLIEGTHTRMSFVGCKLTNNEILGESSASSGGTRLGTLFFEADVPAQPILFDACILSTRPIGLVQGKGIPASRLTPDDIEQIHEYGALTIFINRATEIDVTVRHCVFHADDVNAVADKAHNDLRADVDYSRFFRFDGGIPAHRRLGSMFETAGLSPPNFLLAGVLLFPPLRGVRATRTHFRVVVDGCLITSSFNVGVLSVDQAAVEVRHTWIDSAVSFVWGGRNNPGLDVLIEQVNLNADRFMLVDLSGVGRRTIEHRNVELTAGDATWSWWTDPRFQPGTINYAGHRTLTGPLSPRPCDVEADLDRGSDRRFGLQLGMPGDQLKVVDPAALQPAVWLNTQSGEPWMPRFFPDWRLLWVTR